MNFNVNNLAWEKSQGLLPAIVQDAETGVNLMLGYMNKAALLVTIETNWVTFFSRTKQRLWTKGETSGNKLALINIHADCDNDTLLIFAKPTGVICHTGTQSCFADLAQTDWEFIQSLEKLLADRKLLDAETSYTTTLFNSGLSRIAQKVGEESVEVILAALDKNDEDFCEEVADLFFHLLVLLQARNMNITRVISVLKERNSLHR